MTATITIIATTVEEPDQFESMDTDERRYVSAGWQAFPARSGRYPDDVFLRATGVRLGIYEGKPEYDAQGRLHSFIIDRRTLEKVLPDLVAAVEADPKATAGALVAECGGTADLAKVAAALQADTWPEGDDPAEEAAAFAHHLLKYARIAVNSANGICWEFRGDFPLQPW
ncbi:MAG: hypothetical protein IT370_30735 [Deltaproteobacteria bacterium]|nr:hypothetical protein [Deltaproteobacteria bacterium]